MMGNRQYTNDASALLAGSITAGSTTIAVATGFGALFPSPTGTQYFIVAIEDTSGNTEYIAIGSRSGDNLQVEPVSAQFPAGGRGQEGTTPQSFTANLARVEIRLTAAQQAGLYEKDGDTLTGPMNMGGQLVTNGILSTGISIESATEIVNTPLRGLAAGTGNQITVPTDGVSRAQAGGVNIVVKTDPVNAFEVGMILMYFGAPANLAAGWHVCDGGTYNGHLTPNLMDHFIVGAGNLYPLAANGNIGETTSAASAGTPVISGHALTIAELAVHAHPFDYFFGNTGGPIYNPGGGPGGNYFAGGGGGGVRNSYAGSNAGSGAAHTHGASALAPHSHTVNVGPFYALYFAMFCGT
jgi:hypothetical protein